MTQGMDYFGRTLESRGLYLLPIWGNFNHKISLGGSFFCDSDNINCKSFLMPYSFSSRFLLLLFRLGVYFLFFLRQDFALQLMLAKNSQQSFCLGLSNAGIIGICQHSLIGVISLALSSILWFFIISTLTGFILSLFHSYFSVLKFPPSSPLNLFFRDENFI